MMFDDDFFSVKSKCSKCLVKTRKCPVKDELDNPILASLGQDILVIIPQRKFQDRAREFLESKGVENYTLIVGLECNTEGLIPSPLYHQFRVCNTLSKVPFVPKAIMTFGSAHLSITHNDDIPYWGEYRELNFNNTFFYTGYEYNKAKGTRVRVYPLPDLFEIDKDQFEAYFANFQLSEIKQYVSKFEKELFTAPELIACSNLDHFLFDYAHHIQDEVAYDTETNSLNMFQNGFRIGCVTLSFDGKTGFYIPFDPQESTQWNEFFKGKKGITANGKYDSKCFKRFGIDTPVDDDIILLKTALNTDRMLNSLKSHSWSIGFGGYEDDLDKYLSNHKVSNYLDIPHEVIFPYATLDAVVTKLVKDDAVYGAAKQRKVYKIYREVLIPVNKVFQEVEEEGIGCNRRYLNKLNIELHKELDALEIKIRESLKSPSLDINSLDDLGRALQKAGLPNLGTTQKGTYQTGESILSEWEKLGHPVATELLAHRSTMKMISSFVGGERTSETEDEDAFFKDSKKKEIEGITKVIQPDGKFHSVYRVFGAASSRSSCIEENQVVTIKGGDKKIKDVEVGDEVLTHMRRYCKVTQVLNMGSRKIFKLKTETKELLLTEDHRVLTQFGWQPLKDLDLKIDKIFCSGSQIEDILSLEPQKEEAIVYDLTVEYDHSFVASGICVHNCTYPNVQQAPKRGKEGKRFRPIFSVPDHCVFLDADFSAFQLKQGAIQSGDPKMIEVFKNNGDLHAVTGHAIFCPDMDYNEFLKKLKDSPYKEYRQSSKCFVKGTLIMTNKGPLPIEDFVGAKNSGEHTPYTGDILLQDRYGNLKEIESTYYHAETPITIEIELENGDTIEVSETHQFPVLRDGMEVKVFAKDLLESDELIHS